MGTGGLILMLYALCAVVVLLVIGVAATLYIMGKREERKSAGKNEFSSRGDGD